MTDTPPIWGDSIAPHLVLLTPCRNQIDDIIYPHLLAQGIQAALDWSKITAGAGVTSVGVQRRAHVADARCRLTKDFLDMEGHLALWIDDDMAPPTGLFSDLYRALVQLRTAGIKVGAVSAVCRRVTDPWETCVNKGGIWLEPQKDGPEILNVDVAGFGAILVTGECMAAVYAETGGRPFELRPGKGEDAWFCEHAARLGFRTYAKMNTFVGHKDSHIVDEDFVRMQRASFQ